jgi:hypothetical protein
MIVKTGVVLLYRASNLYPPKQPAPIITAI